MAAHTFGPPMSVGSLSGLDYAVADQGQLVLFSERLGGLHEQVTPADGSVPATTDTVISPDGGGVKAVVLPGGAVLIAHETALFSNTLADTTNVDLQASTLGDPRARGLDARARTCSRWRPVAARPT